MDNSLFLSYLSIKTPVSMDNPPFLLRLSIKMPLFMDNPAYFLSTRGRHSMDKGPSITQRPDTLSNKAAIFRVSSLRVN